LEHEKPIYSKVIIVDREHDFMSKHVCCLQSSIDLVHTWTKRFKNPEADPTTAAFTTAALVCVVVVLSVFITYK
jgi:hypothetical protein